MKNLCLLTTAVLTMFNMAFGQFAPNYLGESAEGALEDEGVIYDLVGGGALSTNPGGNDDGLGRGATGMAFYKKGVFQGNLVFCLGTTGTVDLDSTTATPGATLLQPGNGSVSVQFDYRSNSLLSKPKWGWSASFVGATATWNVEGVQKNAIPLSARLQAARILFDAETKIGTFRGTADLGLSYRGYYGDASADKQFKEAAFGTTMSNFMGIELGLNFWISDAHVFFNIPFLWGDQVDGLTNGQAVFGIAMNGRMLKNL